jgi:O-antigen chain-terminating methyltransferase
VTDEQTQAGAVDVARLMEEIKERVRQRKASGVYSEDEVRRITQMELQITETLPGLQGEVEQQLAELNERWDPTEEPVITSHRPLVGPVIVGAKRLLRQATRPYVSLVLARQADFNSRLLQLLNAFVLPVRDTLARLHQRGEALSLELHERLTAEHAESGRRHRALAARVDALVGEVAALRATVERARDPGPALAVPPSPTVPAGAAALPGPAYVRFEDRHRGTREEIRERQRTYLPLFPAGPILDVGCGRGEFLELCRDAGLDARGIDVDAGMIARCREAGLAAEQAEALAYLDRLPDESLGGLFCAQVIEHLPPDAVVALVRLAHAKLRSGGVLVCETPNPACLTVFSGAFYVDLTHVKPIHPEAARFLLEAAGFVDVEIRFVNPYPPEMKLQRLEPEWYLRRYELEFLSGINANLERLNEVLWGAQDYAVVGRKA